MKTISSCYLTIVFIATSQHFFLPTLMEIAGMPIRTEPAIVSLCVLSYYYDVPIDCAILLPIYDLRTYAGSIVLCAASLYTITLYNFLFINAIILYDVIFSVVHIYIANVSSHMFSPNQFS